MDLWDIPECEGKYSVDRNSGQVWSHTRMSRNRGGFMERKGRFLVAYPDNSSGYLMVRVAKNDGRTRRYKLHRLIYAAHHPEFDLHDKNMEVDHINHNKLDNTIDNLRHCTRSQQNTNRIMPEGKLGKRYIQQRGPQSFRVMIRAPNRGDMYRKTFKTLEEAISHRDEMLPQIKGECFEFIPK
jgi:hypothetical protein